MVRAIEQKPLYALGMTANRCDASLHVVSGPFGLLLGCKKVKNVSGIGLCLHKTEVVTTI